MNTRPPRRVRVQIDREGGRSSRPFESFHGIVLAETSTHYRVQWVTASEWLSTEWFAKAGPRVQCTELDDDLSPVTPPTEPLAPTTP